MQSLQPTARVQEILGHYAGVNDEVRENLQRILMQGRLGGTGRMVILPVDQGFEHGPARSFAPNPPAYDPSYFPALAMKAGLSAYAAPLGSLRMIAHEYAEKLPLILKMNSSNSLSPVKDQAVTASVAQALQLGCAAIGFTVYPGSEFAIAQFETLQMLAEEAHDNGLAVVVWGYPRGPQLAPVDETALDVVAYSAHMAALLGADIIKVKLPSAHIAQDEAQGAYKNIAKDTLADRVAHIVQCCFNGKRLVVFSGGAAKGSDSVLDDTRAIMSGGGNGSIIGRNTFQRPEAEALQLLDQVIGIYKG